MASRLARLDRLREFDALLLTSLIWFLAKFLRYAFPPLFGRFQAVYGVSNAVVGAAFTGLMLAYALMQFPSGALADRLGSVRVVVAGALVAAAGALVVGALSPLWGAFPLLVAGMLLVGVGTGAHKTVAVRLMSTVYPARTGRALGVLDTFGAFSGIAAPAAVVAATGTVGWRAVFLAGGAAGVALAALFARRAPRRIPAAASPDTDADPVGGREYVALFADPRFALFVCVTALFAFAFTGTTAFLPLYLTEAAGLRPSLANSLYGLLFAVSLVQLATGDLSDRLGKLPVIGVALGVATAGLGGLLIAASPLGFTVAVAAVGLGSHGFRPVRSAYLVGVIPEAVAGGTLGIVRTGLMVAGAVAPAVVGYLSDAAGYGVAFGVLFGAMGTAVLAVGVLVALGGDGEDDGSEDDDSDDSEDDENSEDGEDDENSEDGED